MHATRRAVHGAMVPWCNGETRVDKRAMQTRGGGGSGGGGSSGSGGGGGSRIGQSWACMSHMLNRLAHISIQPQDVAQLFRGPVLEDA